MRRAVTTAALALALARVAAQANGVFFDDFSHADRDALAAGGWTLRTAAGHPGVPGAAVTSAR